MRPGKPIPAAERTNVTHPGQSGGSVRAGSFVELLRNVVQTGNQYHEIKAHVLPHNRGQHGEQEVGLIFPVDVFRYNAHVCQKLVHHAAVIQENQVEHQSQSGGGDDNGEKVERTEQLSAHPDAVHQQRQDQGDAYLENDGTDGEDHGVFQGGVQLGIREECLIVDIPGLVDPLGRSAQAGDVAEAVDDILDKGIVEKQNQKGKGRDQEDDQRRFPFIQCGTHMYSLPQRRDRLWKKGGCCGQPPWEKAWIS